MGKEHSTSRPGQSKPDKPYREFPLFPHDNGSWCKKIRGKLHYFGPWDQPEKALEKYNREKDALHAGRRPREVSEGVVVKDVANSFWNHKRALVESGELSPRTMSDYQRVTDFIVTALGKSRLVDDLGPDDFAELRTKMAKQWGLHTTGKMIQSVRSIFKDAYDAGMIDRPVRFGPSF